jgi:hypothetical protein
MVLMSGLIAAALLVSSEFADLYQIHSSTRRAALQSVTGGSHNAYALIPIALLALGLSWGAAIERSRPALLALAVLGVLALLIALVGDLPDAQSSGLVTQSGHYVTATSNAATGMYLETAGGVMLLITAGLGFLLGEPPTRPPRRRRPSREVSGS